MLKNFLSVYYFKELKDLIIIEIVMILLLSLLITTPEYQSFIQIKGLTFFNPFALGFTLLTYCLSCAVDPEKYFNLATFIFVNLFTYGCFWFMFEVMIKLN